MDRGDKDVRDGERKDDAGQLMLDAEVPLMAPIQMDAENENQGTISTREHIGHGRTIQVSELRNLEEDDPTPEDTKLSSNDGLSLSHGFRTNSSQEIEDARPVEDRLLQALQQEMGLPIGTTLSTPSALHSSSANDCHVPDASRPDLAPNPLNSLNNTLPSFTAGEFEYRSRFPARDVANLRGHHWQILRHVITPKSLGLTKSNTTSSSKPSSKAIDEMIQYLSGATKAACLNFREAQKEIWRRGQKKHRAIARANKDTEAVDNEDDEAHDEEEEEEEEEEDDDDDDPQLLDPSARPISIPGYRPHVTSDPRQDRYSSIIPRQGRRLSQRNVLAYSTEYTVDNMPVRSFSPAMQRRSSFRQPGADELEAGTIEIPRVGYSLLRRNPLHSNRTYQLPPISDQQLRDMASAPSVPDPLSLPTIRFPLSEEEKAEIQRWLNPRI